MCLVRGPSVSLYQTCLVPEIPGQRPIRSYSLGHIAAAAQETVPITKPQGQRPDRSRCSASQTRVVPLVTQITPECFLVPANGDG